MLYLPFQSDTTPFMPIQCHTVPFHLFVNTCACSTSTQSCGLASIRSWIHPFLPRSFQIWLWYPLVGFNTASLSLNCTLTPVGKVLDGLPRNIKCQLHPCYQ